MKMTIRTKLLSLILCLVLTWTAALFTGCTDSTKEAPENGTANSKITTVAGEAYANTSAAAEAVQLGEGESFFTFTVTDGDGNDTVFHIATDKTTVGEALMELGLLEGDEGQYGLYVKTVNGIFAEYETTGTYWAFYVNGEYGMTGVDMTEIENGASYAFKIEK